MARKPYRKESKALNAVDQLEPIEEGELRQRVMAALKEAGFDWITDVRLAWHIRVPNWSVTGFSGEGPDKDWLRASKHPVVEKLQNEFALIRPKGVR